MCVKPHNINASSEAAKQLQADSLADHWSMSDGKLKKLMTIAPKLRRRLKLPVGFAECNGWKDLLIGSLLVGLGLTLKEAYGLEKELFQRKFWIRAFDAIPWDERLPEVSNLPVWPENFADLSDCLEDKRFFFACGVEFGASNREITNKFEQWLRAQRKAFGLKKSGKVPRDRSKYARDLVAFALSEARWDLTDIEEQLRHMGLPSIYDANQESTEAKTRLDGREPHSIAKARLRKIRHRIKGDLKKAKKFRTMRGPKRINQASALAMDATR